MRAYLEEDRMLHHHSHVGRHGVICGIVVASEYGARAHVPTGVAELVDIRGQSHTQSAARRRSHAGRDRVVCMVMSCGGLRRARRKKAGTAHLRHSLRKKCTMNDGWVWSNLHPYSLPKRMSAGVRVGMRCTYERHERAWASCVMRVDRA